MYLPDKEARGRFLGCPSQMYGVDRMIFDEGKAKGTAVYEVRTGGGLTYKVMADTGLDIGELTYRGVNIHYLSKNSHQSPYAYHPFESDFLHTFPAGMLYTCGLLSTGAANRDENIWQPIHGRYHSIPGEQCAGRVTEDDVLEVSGVVRETRFSGHVLEMRRTISSPVGSAKLTLTDRLTNCTSRSMEYMLLYHMNFGYPFLSKELLLELPMGTRSSCQDAPVSLEVGNRFCDPSDEGVNQLLLHRIPACGGYTHVRLCNPVLGFGVGVSWSADSLPLMLQWKCMRCGEYVLGIEPANTHNLGRAEERKNATIGRLAPWETKTMKLRLEFFNLP